MSEVQKFLLSQKLQRLELWKREKLWWLSDFSSGRNKRPDHEIDRKRDDIAFLGDMAADYRSRIARKSEGEAA